MYWPHGVPRVYAVNGPDIAYSSSEEDRNIQSFPPVNNSESLDTQEGEGHDEAQHDRSAKHESQTESLHDTNKTKWEDEAIKGVCVSRSGQMLATISESSIALWQTRVC